MLQTAKTLHFIRDRAVHRGVRLIDRLDIGSEADRSELVASIMASPASIPPKYFYDAIGCVLFEAICALPEYYPTRTERSILIDQRDAIAQVVGTHKQLVDLGAGDCAKAALLLPVLHARRYVAVDIAASAIEPALGRLAAEMPGIDVVGVVTDFSRSLDISGAIDGGPVTFFYPGSSIGNFAPADAHDLLARVRWHCGPGGGLLIGVDTKKDPRRLVAAYDDALGVTGAFNRNVLNHVNALVGSNFYPASFRHVARYDAEHGRIEMHLQAAVAQEVRIGDRLRHFEAGESIHTENSYKYAPAEFEAMLHDAGFADVRRWQDPAGDFAVFYAQ
jgi:dimethylhistidine N-methyltransferase